MKFIGTAIWSINVQPQYYLKANSNTVMEFGILGVEILGCDDILRNNHEHNTYL